MLRAIDAALCLVGIAVAALAVHHGGDRLHAGLAVRHPPVTGEALDFLAVRVARVQLHAVGIRRLAETVAIQADRFLHPAGLLDFPLMAGFLTTGPVGDEFAVVDLDKAPADDFLRYLVTTPAIGSNGSPGFRIAAEEMTGETGVCVHAEMGVSFEMAMTRPAGDPNAVDDLVNVLFVREADTAAVELLARQLLGIVAFRPQAGGIDDRGAGFCADPPDHAVHGLGQTVDLPLDQPGEAGPQMALETIDLRVGRLFPTVVVWTHNMARMAESGLSRGLHHRDTEEPRTHQQEDYPCRPAQATDDTNRQRRHP